MFYSFNVKMKFISLTHLSSNILTIQNKIYDFLTIKKKKLHLPLFLNI